MFRNLFRRSDNNTGNESTPSTSQTDDHALFWSKFQEYCIENTSLEISESNQGHNDYYGFYLKGFKREDAHLTVWKRKEDDRIGVFVVLQKRSTEFVASEMFDKLKEYKEIIQSTLNVEDEWKWFKEPTFPNRGPMIGFYKTQTNEESDFEWIVERLEMLTISFVMTIKILMNS